MWIFDYLNNKETAEENKRSRIFDSIMLAEGLRQITTSQGRGHVNFTSLLLKEGDTLWWKAGRTMSKETNLSLTLSKENSKFSRGFIIPTQPIYRPSPSLHKLSSHEFFISYMIAEIMLQKMASEGNHVAENTVQGAEKESNKNLYAIINS
ncbi:hypothetical protein CUMW_237880 [Citrus unshiu]|uniref:Uncharacterized protein n=1 Tax=Citrus unshiu TaxID=55188 RepID=A0A2H5QK53_CITUN|nr:hypothetical protein CUMW_237880 [Citrus unshiu]